MTFATIFASQKRGDKRRRGQSEKRARALAFYEADPTRTFVEVGEEMGCSHGWASQMIEQARNERRQRKLKIETSSAG